MDMGNERNTNLDGGYGAPHGLPPASYYVGAPELVGPPTFEPPAAVQASAPLSAAARIEAARSAAGLGDAKKKRRHAAKGSRIAALSLSLLATSGLAAFMGLTDSADLASSAAAASGGSVNAVAVASTQPTGSATPTTAAADVATDTGATTAAPASTAPVTEPAAAATGTVTYNGDTYTNRWGPVQVQVTISDGQITSVETLQYPDGDHKSVAINQQAVPQLESMTLANQSASVDVISGATYTSEGYAQSMQSALDYAAADGVWAA